MTAPAESSGRRRTLGDYEILHPLKTGGMGEVLLARKRGSAGFEKLLALKTIRGELRESDHLQKMFVDEARLLSRLSHPQIAQVYDFGEDNGVFYLAMEYVPGIRFRDLIRRRPPPAVSVRAMAQVLRGLHAAHDLTDLSGESLGVVHRDVTPENLLLTFEGRVKILDFGIALVRGREAPVTEFGSVKGKPPYLAPEQLKNEAVDRRTDVFSAALVLHELLTGHPVFTGNSVYAVARAIDLQDIEPPSARVGILPVRLDEAVLRGLEKSPERRWATAQAFAEALESIAAATGGATLEEYAAAHMAAERDQHRRHLRSLLVETEASPPARDASHRATGVVTAQAGVAAADPQSLVKRLTSQRPAVLLGDGATPTRLPSVLERSTAPTRGQSAPDAERRVVEREQASADQAPFTTSEERAIGRTPRRRRLGIALLLLVAAGALGLGVGVLSRGDRASSDAQQPVASVPLDAARGALPPPAIIPDAGVAVALSNTADAGQVAPAPRRPPRAVTARAPRKPPRTPSDARPAPPRPAPPTPVAPAATPTGHGLLTVSAEPFALVRINGKNYGATPIYGKRFPAGRYEIVLTHPDSGTERHRRVVNLTPDGHERVVLR